MTQNNITSCEWSFDNNDEKIRFQTANENEKWERKEICLDIYTHQMTHEEEEEVKENEERLFTLIEPKNEKGTCRFLSRVLQRLRQTDDHLITFICDVIGEKDFR